MKRNLLYNIKNVHYYYLLKLLFFGHLGIIGSTFIIYFYELGFSKLETNILNSIFTLSVVLVEIPTGTITDSIGYRKTLLGAGILLTISMLLFYLHFGVVFIIMAQVCWGISFAIESGSLDSWIINTDEIKSIELDRLYAKSNQINNIFFAIGGLIGAYIAFYDIKNIWVTDNMKLLKVSLAQLTVLRI